MLMLRPFRIGMGGAGVNETDNRSSAVVRKNSAALSALERRQAHLGAKIRFLAANAAAAPSVGQAAPIGRYGRIAGPRPCGQLGWALNAKQVGRTAGLTSGCRPLDQRSPDPCRGRAACIARGGLEKSFFSKSRSFYRTDRLWLLRKRAILRSLRCSPRAVSLASGGLGGSSAATGMAFRTIQMTIREA